MFGGIFKTICVWDGVSYCGTLPYTFFKKNGQTPWENPQIVKACLGHQLVCFQIASPRIILTCKTFTLANTGLEKPNQYPEIGSAFKAAFMKGAMWFFTKIAIELAEANPDDTH